MAVEQHEQGMVKISALKGADYNPRIMPDAEMRNLMASLKEFGFAQPVVARKEDGLILGGHQRVEAMKRIAAEMGGGDIKIPVVWIAGLSDEKAKLLNVALNRIHGEWDFEKLGDLFGTLTVADGDFTVSGFSGKEIDDIIKLTAEDAGKAPNPVLESDEPTPPPAANEVVVKMTFDVPVADVPKVKAALAAYGMKGTRGGGAALVKVALAASAHVICEEEIA